jgi:hypothetical protein
MPAPGLVAFNGDLRVRLGEFAPIPCAEDSAISRITSTTPAIAEKTRPTNTALRLRLRFRGPEFLQFGRKHADAYIPNASFREADKTLAWKKRSVCVNTNHRVSRTARSIGLRPTQVHPRTENSYRPLEVRYEFAVEQTGHFRGGNNFKILEIQITTNLQLLFAETSQVLALLSGNCLKLFNPLLQPKPGNIPQAGVTCNHARHSTAWSIIYAPDHGPVAPPILQGNPMRRISISKSPEGVVCES